MQNIVRDILNSKDVPVERRRELVQAVVSAYVDTDVDYLQALYFPETSNSARIPSKFGIPSSTFTQKFHFYVNTGSSGCGMIGIAPQDTTFRCCFQLTSPASNPNGVLRQDFAPDRMINFPSVSDSSYIPDKFSEARLVGSSMQVSYIGTVDMESGFITGSHLFDSNPFILDEEHIEEGYFPTRAKPSDGLRLVYLPKDQKDMSFEPTTIKMVPAGNDSNFHAADFLPHAGASDADMQNEDGDDTLKIQVKSLQVDSQAAQSYTWHSVQHKGAPAYYWGQHANKGESQCPNMMVCYFKGLPKNEDWIRVDVVRHFEGIPRHELKDFIGVRRPQHNQKTIDFVSNASHTTNLHSHDLSVSKVYHDFVKPVIHTVPDNPRHVIGRPTEDGMKSMASTALGLGLGGLATYMGAPSLAPIASSIGAGLGTAMYDGFMGTGSGSSNQLKAITF